MRANSDWLKGPHTCPLSITSLWSALHVLLLLLLHLPLHLLQLYQQLLLLLASASAQSVLEMHSNALVCTGRWTPCTTNKLSLPQRAFATDSLSM